MPARATRRRPEGRGQPRPRRAEDESLDGPTGTGPDWPALEKDLNKPPSRLPLQALSLQWHWRFSGRILASHAGDPGSIPGQCIVVVLFLSFAGPWTEECYSPRDRQKSKRTERLTHIYLLYFLKRMDSRFLKGQEGPLLVGTAVPRPWKTSPTEVSFQRGVKGKEQSRDIGTLLSRDVITLIQRKNVMLTGHLGTECTMFVFLQTFGILQKLLVLDFNEFLELKPHILLE